MVADQSPFEILGLDPTADLAQVERAYRGLIKQFHPDRSGGDSVRAAEINRAYREIRASLDGRGEVAMYQFQRRRAPGWSRTIWAGVILLVLASAAMILTVLTPRQAVRIAGLPNPAVPTAAPADIMDEPLNLREIDSSALEALRLMQRSDQAGLAEASGACFQELRLRPDIIWFDRCTAFDHAVVVLQDRDPLRDRGPFSELAVSSRVWSAAAGLSNDSVAADLRLRRIQLRVDVVLAPNAA